MKQRRRGQQYSNTIFTITAEIHARALANFYCQYADRHMNLKFMRRVSEREPVIRRFVIEKKQIDVSSKGCPLTTLPISIEYFKHVTRIVFQGQGSRLDQSGTGKVSHQVTQRHAHVTP